MNTVESRSGESIKLDSETGVVSLSPGTYHIVGSSIVTYFDSVKDVDAKVSTEARPNGGYCLLQYLGKTGREDEPIAIGTISNANMIPSMIDTFLKVEDSVQIVLTQQSGKDASNLFLQVYVEGSTNHIFARLSIEKVR